MRWVANSEELEQYYAEALEIKAEDVKRKLFRVAIERRFLLHMKNNCSKWLGCWIIFLKLALGIRDGKANMKFKMEKNKKELLI